jgi:formylglycine-generating enzyme required for sulfatase activity
VKGDAFRPILVIFVLVLIVVGLFALYPRYKESHVTQAALAERDCAMQSRDEARAAETRRLARSAWLEAKQVWYEGETNLVFGRYEEAADDYRSAVEAFASARRVAVAQALLPEEERQPQVELPAAPVERPISQVVSAVERGLARGDQRGLRAADAALAELRRREPKHEQIRDLQYRITNLRSRLALTTSKRADLTGIITRIEKGLARDDAEGLATAEAAMAELQATEPGHGRLARFRLQAEALAERLARESKQRELVDQLLARIESGLAAGTESSLARAREDLEALRRRDPGHRRIAGLAAELDLRALPLPPAIRGSGAGEEKSIEILPGVEMKFVWIPPGSFRMGSPATERDRGDDEGPQHEVTIRSGFWLGRCEMTQATYRAVMGQNPSMFKGDWLPVENVSWNDARAFIGKLNAPVRGTPYRLPTEAEWEYACRAGTTTAFNTGNCINSDQANYDGEQPYAGCYNGRDRGAPVNTGSFIGNVWGLYDMHGNVCEWCADRYDARYYEVSPAVDPVGPSGGDPGRVHRGGGWSGDGDSCRSARRNGNNPDKRSGHIGFRLVRSVQ